MVGRRRIRFLLAPRAGGAMMFRYYRHGRRCDGSSLVLLLLLRSHSLGFGISDGFVHNPVLQPYVRWRARLLKRVSVLNV